MQITQQQNTVLVLKFVLGEIFAYFAFTKIHKHNPHAKSFLIQRIDNQIYIFIPPFQKSVGYLINPVFSSLLYLAEYGVNMTEGVTSVSRDIYGLHMMVFWVSVAIAIVVFVIY
jgi:hypothetical protein